MKRNVRKLEGVVSPPSDVGVKRSSSFSSDTEAKRTQSFAESFASFTSALPKPPAAEPTKESNNDSLSLKLKIKDLSANLLTVTKQRDESHEKLKAMHIASKTSGNIEAPAVAVTKSVESQNLEQQIDSLTTKLEESTNSQSALRELTKSLRKENDEMQDQKNLLTESNVEAKAIASDFKEQVSSMFDDMAALADESEKLKLQVDQLSELNKSLLSGDLNSTIEQLKDEYRERNAGLEFRLAGLMQKLESAEDAKTKLELELKGLSTSLNVPVSLIDHQDLINEKALVEALRKENRSLKETSTKTFASLSKSQIQLAELKKSYDVSLSKLNATIGSLESKISTLAVTGTTQIHIADIDKANLLRAQLEIALTDGTSEPEIEGLMNQIEILQKGDAVSDLKKNTENSEMEPANNDSMQSGGVSDLTDIINTLQTEKGLLERELEHANLLRSEFEVKFENEMRVVNIAVKDKDKALNDIQTQLVIFKEKLVAEEEKKSKSVNLLRHSKTKIMKLESDLKNAMEQLKGSNSLAAQFETLLQQNLAHSENVQKLQNAAKQSEIIIQNLRANLEEEKERHFQAFSHVNEIEAINIGLEVKYEEDMKKNIIELESLRNENKSLQVQFQEWNSRIHGHDSSLDALEQDLEVSKRLFQTKSIENDSLKMRISELEGKLYEASFELGNNTENISFHVRDVGDAKQKLSASITEIEKLKSEIKTLKLKYSEETENVKLISVKNEESLTEINTLRESIRKAELQDHDAFTKISETKVIIILIIDAIGRG